MPEILEVELYRQTAERALGRTITSAKVVDGRYCRGATTPRLLKSALVGQRFNEARRIGKLLLLDSDGPTLGLRFGMTGGLVVDGYEALDRLVYGPGRFDAKWVRFELGFEDGSELLLHDPRRFGSVELSPDESLLGPDALTVTLPQLRAALSLGTTQTRGKAAPLKARLLDQHRLAGVGNLLADESLWRAGLSPERRDALTDDELKVLHRHLRATLRQLGTRGGSHMGNLMDERHPGGRCPKDGTALVTAQVGGRTSWWCPLHQE
jgi:formamidopyrimidine-DNA glycosylase